MIIYHIFETSLKISTSDTLRLFVAKSQFNFQYIDRVI